MLLVWIVVFFVLCGLIALACSWHDIELRWVGYALVFGNITSVLVWYLRMNTERAAIYTLTEIGIDFLAFLAFYTRCLIGKASRWECGLLILIVMISTMSISANVALAWLTNADHPDDYLVAIHAAVTNWFYFAECLLTAITGIISGVRTGHINRRNNDRGNIVVHNDNRRELEGMDK